MRKTPRIGIGIALALSLIAPAGLASTAAFAAENDPVAVEQVETEHAHAPETEATEAELAEDAPVPAPELGAESEPELAPRSEPAPEATELVATEEDAVAESDEAATRVESEDTESAARAESQPRLPEASGGSAQLLPPNTARYVTFRVLDHTGAPAQRTIVNIPGFGERVVDTQGEATYLSLPYGEFTFSVIPSLNSRPDLQSYSGNVTVAQQQHLFTVTLLQKPGANAIGFQGVITNASTGEPLIGGGVWVEPVDGSADRFTARTNTDGTYWISGLENKPYKVKFDTYGYVSVDTIITPSSAYPVHNIALDPSRYYATGLITDPEGYPVHGARIEFIDPATGTVVKDNTQSSTGGNYAASFEISVGSPEPGMYLMRVVPPAGTDMSPTYYPGVYDAAQATPADFSVLAPRVDLQLLPTQLVAHDDIYVAQPWGASGATLDITDPARGLLANDDGYKSIHVSGIQGVINANSPDITRSTDQGGEVTVATDGTFSYAPPANFTGVDTFTYMLRDEGPIAVETATVRITVGEPDDDDEEPVVLRDDHYATPFETLLDRTADCDAQGVGANDGGDIRNFVLYDNATHGSLDFDDKGCFTYLPDPGFSGTDSFVYTVEAGPNAEPTGLTATVTIVVGAEDAPVANDDEYRVNAGTAFIMPEASGGFLANDTGASALTVYTVLGDPVVAGFEIFTNEGNRLLVSADGRFTFIPLTDFIGTDSVTYTVIDEDGRISEPATVRFIVGDPDAGTGDNEEDTGSGSGSSSDSGTSNDSSGSGSLASTGGRLPAWGAVLSAAMLVIGGLILAARRVLRRSDEGI